MSAVNDIHVGYDGTGTLSVADGGLVATPNNVLLAGNNVGSHGTIDVATGGMVNARNINVGYEGTGSMSIASGGIVATTIMRIGGFASGVGQLTMDGPTSSLAVPYASGFTSGFIVGQFGQGTLAMTNGEVATAAVTEIGEYPAAGDCDCK